MSQTYFLNKDKTLVHCEVLKSGKASRQIKILEGPDADKTQNVHPEGVSWGRQYPRLFTSATRPKDIFAFRGRTLLHTHTEIDDPKAQAAIPLPNSGYRFQPFLADIIDSIHGRENVLLTGGTGVGKTTHVTQLANRIGQPVLRINFNGETRMSDLLGKVQVIAGETIWVDGVLPSAMRLGWWLILDELDFADPAVLSLLHPVLEEDSCLVLKENSGDIVRPHPNFRLFATANSIGAMQDRAGAYSGTNQMNDAFLDRWQIIMVDNLPEKEEIKVVKNTVPGLKAKHARSIVKFAAAARSKNSDMGLDFSSDNFSTRKVLAWAKKTALHRNPITGAKLSWLDKMPESEQEVIMKLLSTHFSASAKKSRSGNKPISKLSHGTFKMNKGLGRGRPKKSVAPAVPVVLT